MQAAGILIALAVAAVGLIAVRRAPWAAGIIIMQFPLEQLLQSYYPALVATPWLMNVAFGSMALAAVAGRFVRGENVTFGYLNPAFLLILIIYAYQVLGWTWSPGAEYAVSQMKRGVFYIGLNVIILPLLVRDVEDFASMMKFLLFFGTGVVLLTLFNPRGVMRAGRLQLELGAYGQIRGNPLATGYGGGVVAIVAALALFRRSLLMNAFRIVAVLSGMAMAVMSGSRGQAFGAAVVIIVMYPFARKVRDLKQFFVTAFGLLITGGLVLLAFDLFISEDNLERYTTGATQAVGARLERIMIMTEEFLARPAAWFTGLGPGGFDAVTGRSYVHNVPVEVLTELGLVGVVLFGSMLVLVYRYWRQAVRTVADEPVLRAAAAVLGAICLFQFLLSCKQGSIISSVGPMGLFALTARIVYTQVKTVQEQQEPLLASDQWDEFDYSEYGEFDEYGEYPGPDDGDYVPAT